MRKIYLFLAMSKNIVCAKSIYFSLFCAYYMFHIIRAKKNLFLQKARNWSIPNHSRLNRNKPSILHIFSRFNTIIHFYGNFEKSSAPRTKRTTTTTTKSCHTDRFNVMNPRYYTASQKHESTLLHTYVLIEVLTADRSCTTKYSYRKLL